MIRTTSISSEELKRQIKTQLILCRENYIDEEGKIVISKLYDPIRKLVGCIGERWENKDYELEIGMIAPLTYRIARELNLEIA